MEDPSSPTGEKIIQAYEDSKDAENQQSRASLQQQLRLKEEEIARLQEQMRQQQLTKERENAELRRQLQSAQIPPSAQPQKITATVRRVSKPEEIKYHVIVYIVCIHVHILYLVAIKHM